MCATAGGLRVRAARSAQGGGLQWGVVWGCGVVVVVVMASTLGWLAICVFPCREREMVWNWGCCYLPAWSYGCLTALLWTAPSWHEHCVLQALELYLAVLPEDHPSVLDSMGNLGDTLRKRKKFDEAEGLLLKV